MIQYMYNNGRLNRQLDVQFNRRFDVQFNRQFNVRFNQPFNRQPQAGGEPGRETPQEERESRRAVLRRSDKKCGFWDRGDTEDKDREGFL